MQLYVYSINPLNTRIKKGAQKQKQKQTKVYGYKWAVSFSMSDLTCWGCSWLASAEIVSMSKSENNASVASQSSIG